VIIVCNLDFQIKFRYMKASLPFKITPAFHLQNNFSRKYVLLAQQYDILNAE
jgi:hypothetical protein